jgi:molecular chaperone DnaJ
MWNQRFQCDPCGGAGHFPVICVRCRGSAKVSRERKFDVTVPRGVESGLQLRLKGEGQRGPFGALGHVLLRITVR